ncbi:hypothetical protein KCU93_g42, partial [Aureobasidium melanogenum]
LPLWVLQSWYVVLDASDLHRCHVTFISLILGILLLAHEIYLQQIFIDICKVDGPRYEGLDLGDIFLKGGSQMFARQGIVVSTIEDPFLDRLGAAPLALGVRLGFLPPSCVLVGTVVLRLNAKTDDVAKVNNLFSVVCILFITEDSSVCVVCMSRSWMLTQSCGSKDFSFKNSYSGIGHGFYLVCSGQCIR